MANNIESKSEKKRLETWAKGLSKKQLVAITVDCVQELILAETVGFYKDTKFPYWENTGERLDGSVSNEE